MGQVARELSLAHVFTVLVFHIGRGEFALSTYGWLGVRVCCDQLRILLQWLFPAVSLAPVLISERQASPLIGCPVVLCGL